MRDRRTAAGRRRIYETILTIAVAVPLVVLALVPAVLFASPAAVAAGDSGASHDVHLAYPQAPRDTIVDTYFGTKVAAPYQWMENLSSPLLHRWVRAENALTHRYLSKIPVRPWLQRRLKALWNFPRQSTPVLTASGRLFFRRNTGLQNQSVLYVQDSPQASPRVLINPNQRWPHGSVALAEFAPSPDGRYLAYALSSGGSDWETIHVLDVRTGKTLPDAVRWVKFSNTAWTNDDRGFYYSRYPTPARGNKINQTVVDQKLYYHTLGTPQSADKLIYARPDLPKWGIYGQVSENGRYLFVTLENGTSIKNELLYADLGPAANPRVAAKLVPLYTRNDAAYEFVGEKHGELYLQTTLDAPRQRIVAAKLSDPAPAHWRTVVPQGKGVIQVAGLAGGDLVVDSNVVATSRLAIYTTSGRLLHDIPLPTLGTVAEISARNDSKSLYYGFTSFLYPTRLYRYDLATAREQTVFAPRLKFDPSRYETRQVFYHSKDGTRVPMFIVARKGIKLDGRNPTVLYGYGGFDVTVTPAYNPVLPAWLELGGVYAIPNLRGGGTYGEKWHRAGMLSHKQNVFDDFAWAAKYLIAHGYTSAKRLGIQGYSNGGLLTGASITERPELFGAAYIGHGVLDMLRYQRFSGGALWAPEYGTSASRKAFKWLYAYSPLQNIKAGTCYPPTFITTSWDDDRVVPMHEFKFTAALQHAQGCANPVLLYTTGATSHIYMPTDKDIAQAADMWSFEAYNLGIKHPPHAAAVSRASKRSAGAGTRR